MARSWSQLAIVAAGTAAVLLLAAYLLAGKLGVLTSTAYLGCILAPGVALYGILAARFRAGRSSLLEVLFYSNVVGLAMTEGGGWLLTRSGVFSLTYLLGLEVGVLVILLVVFRRTVVRRLREGPGSLLTAPKSDTVFLGIVAAVSVLIMLPVLVLASQGFLLSVDNPIYTRVGWAVSSTGAWPNLSQVFYPGATAAGLAPGMPMVYAVFSSVTRIVADPLSASIAVLPMILTPVGLSLLLNRFSRHPLVVYGLPMVWLVAATNYSGFLFNDILSSAFIGAHPDAGASFPAFVAVLILFVDLSRSKSAQWFEVSLLAAAVLGGVLLDQLTFVYIAAALVLFGIPILWSHGIRWCLPRVAAVLAPTVIAFPPYLSPSLGYSSSPGLSSQSIWHLSEWQVNWSFLATNTGLLAEFAFALGVAALIGVLYERRRGWPIGSATSSTLGLLPLTALCGIGMFLTFSNVGSDLLNVVFSRFLEYAMLAAIPLLAFGCDRFLEYFPVAPPPSTAVPVFLSKQGRLRVIQRRRWAVGRILSIVAVGSLFVLAGTVSTASNLNDLSSESSPAHIFSPDILAASEWLNHHAVANTLVAVDGNGGNAIAMSPILAYSGHTTVIRARSALYAQLTEPPPSNVTYYYMNLVMTNPSEANAAAAETATGMEYYVFEEGFSDRQIAVFSLLPYFARVYSNSQISIFQFVGGSVVGYIPAVSYCSSSNAMTVSETSKAYSFAYSTPAVSSGPNIILSTVPDPKGTQYVSYCLDIPTGGQYTLYIHRNAFEKTEFINVSAGGPTLGQVFFLSFGLTLGTPLPLTLPAGPVTLTLTFEGTKGYVDWIDYLILAPTA